MLYKVVVNIPRGGIVRKAKTDHLIKAAKETIDKNLNTSIRAFTREFCMAESTIRNLVTKGPKSLAIIKAQQLTPA